MKRFLGALFVAVGALVVAWGLFSGGTVRDGGSAENAHGGESRSDRIVFELRPFTEPVALYLRVLDSGYVTGMRYSPERMMVMSRLSGSLDSGAAATLFDRVRSFAVKRAMSRNYAGEGLLRGDQFSLTLSNRTTAGFVMETPPALRDVIDDLQRLPARLSEQPSQGEFGRSQEIATERLAQIEKRGVIRFISFGELPTAYIRPIQQVVADPGAFVALPDGALDALARQAEGQEIFLRDGNRAYQIALFRSAVQ